MQLSLSAGTLLFLCLSSASVNAIAVRKFENFQDFDYCGEIVNPFTGTSQCVCINQLNEALVHTQFEGLEPLFDQSVREGPACIPTALPSSSSDFDFPPLTTDSTTSSIASFATATPSDDVEAVGNDPAFDPLDFLNDTPSEISDTSYGSKGDESDDADKYEWLDFSLNVLREG